SPDGLAEPRRAGLDCGRGAVAGLPHRRNPRVRARAVGERRILESITPMTTRTRYAIVASALVIAVGVGTGLVAYYIGAQGGRAADQQGELRFLPRDTAVIVYANVRDLMASEMQRRVSGAFPGPQAGRRGFEEATGINIETDIDRAVLFVEGRGA